MAMHEPYPIILERAIISRGELLPERQDQLIGFAWSEGEVAQILSMRDATAVGMVQVPPGAFISDLDETAQTRARGAKRYWFVSCADEEIHLALGKTTMIAVPIIKARAKKTRRHQDLAVAS